MKKSAVLSYLFLFTLTGCARLITASLSTTASLASARADAVTMLVKVDALKQADFRARAKTATTPAQVDAIEAEFKAYTAKRDKALLGLDKLGLALSALKNAIDAAAKTGSGHFDLAPAIAAFADVKTLLNDLGVQLPGGL